MKVLLLLLLTMGSITLQAQSKNMSIVDTLTKQANMPSPNYSLLAFQFKNLPDSNDWRKLYYYAYCTIMQAYSETPQNIDALIDGADAALGELKSRIPSESERLVLMAMSSQARLNVNPQARAMKYLALFNQYIKEAIDMDPANPRPHLIKGMTLMYMPEAFGGGKEAAKPLLAKAISLFEANDNHKSGIYWGLEMAKYLLEQCK